MENDSIQSTPYGDLLLTKEELVTITGYKHKKKQQAQLGSMGIPFGKDGKERTVVTRKAVHSILSPEPPPTKGSRRNKPDFSKI